ncbi:MAG TPA: hypothetical protein ENN80_07295, partial [Candidatus Hydrogenedentes bacterium]|nr:hypothetical protein [Candidatus Hydrogenedentota bacterium]
MSEATGTNSRLAGLYYRLLCWYGRLPAWFFKGGYSFPPIHYYLEVTRRCNLRCTMCQYIVWLTETTVAEQKEGELSTEEW